LGEIEQALSLHESSGQVVVIARALATTSEKELICYSTGSATADELKVYLKEILPHYMVPNYYVRLENIPLTSNGKVDRKGLPDPAGTGLKQGDYVAPVTDTERKLVKIWSEVLGVSEATLSIKSDFFDLGGNSLKAIRLITKVHQSLSVRLKISDLFFNRELESLARILDGLNHSVKSNFEIEL
jgi:acyl carrier protein